jgi:glutathione S-transferase
MSVWKMHLYGDAYSGNCYKVLLLLSLLKRDFLWTDVDILKGETRTEDFLRMNPLGQIPVLEFAPGQYQTESNAILFRLAYGTPYLPSDPDAVARVLEWMFFEQYSHEPGVGGARYIVRYLGRPSQLEERLKTKIDQGTRALEHMEGRLSVNAYLVGGELSIADIALYAYTHVAQEGGINMSAFPAIGRWLARVRGEPGYVGMGR